MVAVGLHTLWDVFSGFRGATFVGFLSIEVLSLLVAVISLILLVRRVREAWQAGDDSLGGPWVV